MKTHVSIVPTDNLIVVDGISLYFPFTSPDNLHAIQWHDGMGHMEWTDDINHPLYGEAAYAEEVAPYVALWEAEQDKLIEEAQRQPMPSTLEELKAQKRQSFAATFATIEQRAQRPQSSVLAALIDESPVPEPDADYIWQLEDIKATNRELLAQLEACTDWEEAQQIEPWLPPAQASGLKVG